MAPIRPAAVVVAVMLVAPVAALAAPSPTEQLEDAREELDEAGEALAQLEERLDRTQERIAEIDGRLAQASGELEIVKTELAVAEEALEAADDRERTASRALEQAGAQLDDLLERWHSYETVLRRRVANIYKHGSQVTGEFLFEGIAAANDLHAVSVTVRTFEEVVARDRDLARTSVDLARDAAEARSRLLSARAVAVEERESLAGQRERIAELVATRQSLVDQLQRERRERSALLAEIATDREAKLVVIQRLQQRVDELAAALYQAIVTERVDLPFDGPAPAWASALPANGVHWAPAVNAAAGAVGLDGRLLAAVVWTESNFHPSARSPSGAIGLAQLMPGTAAGLGVDPFDPLDNLLGGARYLRAMAERFGSAELALAAYNAGPGRVERAGNRIPDIVETQLYVLRVLERYEHLLAAG